MARVDKDEYDYGDRCYHNVGRAIIGLIVFIVVLAFAFWLVRSILNLTFGPGSSSISQLVGGVIGFVIAICIIIWIIRLPFRFMYGFGRSDIRILRKRYARGEISESQFKRMMKNLRERY